MSATLTEPFGPGLHRQVLAYGGDRAMSEHARWRGAQRNISSAQAQLVVAYGRRAHGHGATHYFFGSREARQYRRSLGAVVERLQGIVVVIGRDELIVTVYRNGAAAKSLRRKAR